MKQFNFKIKTEKVLADTVTPVSIYLKLRDQYPCSGLLESSDYHTSENSFSFICLKPIANFNVQDQVITQQHPDKTETTEQVKDETTVAAALKSFYSSFKITGDESPYSGIFGYAAFDAVQYFEDIKFSNSNDNEYKIPDIYYSFYKYIIAINHYKNELSIIEHLLDGETSEIEKITSLIENKYVATYNFEPEDEEVSNITDQEYKQMVTKGKEHCFRGDVIQVVLARQFSRKYKGDEFNVYRALRSINPSPYLFYFDYGSYKIFGSSPEAQLIIQDGKAYINPIAGTYKRTGNDEADKSLAAQLLNDKKEKAEHVMLVDLARNDLSRNADDVKVEVYGEIQYYSHVLHMVSKVSGTLPEDTNIIKVMGDSFPAGTLSGAPKYMAMTLIDKYENQNRGYYGGCIGFISLSGEFNHAIMIRSFLSKNNTLYYQAGAGIVSESKEESELQEVNNKLAALKTAIEFARNIK